MVLVLGKGGVGKTTTAGALALSMADAGERVHLISTDPAHSVADLFAVELPPGEPTPSPCTPRLVLEELDAEAWAASWMERARAPLVELFDRGTYLDPEDVEGFLDLTLPGVDEVAAALRLADLSATDVDRIVVDTAPTGHALRLLRADTVVASWADAFEAMEAKARAVLESLTRRRVRFASGEVVDDLARGVERFRQAVLEEGEVVVVDRAGSVVEAETARLLETLGDLGLPVGLRVRTAEPEAAEGGDADGGTPVLVPFRSDLRGCEGLRRWGSPPAREAAPATDEGRGEGADVVRTLGVELVLVVGKGGVGKSTCAAATALLLAREGPVRLLGTDPAGSLDDVLDGPGERPEGLSVRQVEAESRFEEVRSRYRHEVDRAFDALAAGGGDAALDRRVVGSFLDLAPPGIDEIFSLLALVEGADDGATLVVDTAPTGHAVRLLALPGTALDWTRQILRTVRKYRAVLGLDAFAETLLDFAKQLRELKLRLTDPARSAAIVVTQPGPLVAAETSRLLRTLDAGGIRVGTVLRNRWPRGLEGGAAPPPSVPVLRAPPMGRPPVGPDALRDFTDRWSVIP